MGLSRLRNAKPFYSFFHVSALNPDAMMIPSPLDLYNYAKVIYDYLKDVKDVGEDRASLLREMVAMQALLEGLESHADEPDWNATMETLRAPRGSFDQ